MILIGRRRNFEEHMLVDSKEFLHGVEQFNRGEFFESHDTWEELWKMAHGEERLLLQGLIQIAVGCYHLGNDKYHAALSQFSKGLEKLRRLPAEFGGVRVEELCGSAAKQAAECERLARAPGAGKSSIRLPSIRLV